MNILGFEKFLESLKQTNRSLKFYVDWKKCLNKCDEVAISLNCLNVLLGKNKMEIRNYIQKLFHEYNKPFEVLPLLLAVRDAREVVLNPQRDLIKISEYLRSPESIYNFICESGLIDIFINGKIKDLYDFVFGIEVGLDSNARKNRSGSIMEAMIDGTFKEAGLCFESQVSIDKFDDLRRVFDKDNKRFDFVVSADKQQYFIECNFYSCGGSKLNEVARAYIEVAQRFKNIVDKNFIWITDGVGWLSSKSNLQEAYKHVEIYNLSNIDSFIRKVQHNG